MVGRDHSLAAVAGARRVVRTASTTPLPT